MKSLNFVIIIYCTQVMAVILVNNVIMWPFTKIMKILALETIGCT